MEEIYPLTIICDRYNGIYSGGKYLAFNLEYDEIPSEINGSDLECMNFWYANKDFVVGKGSYLEEALDDLWFKLQEGLENDRV